MLEILRTTYVVCIWATISYRDHHMVICYHEIFFQFFSPLLILCQGLRQTHFIALACDRLCFFLVYSSFVDVTPWSFRFMMGRREIFPDISNLEGPWGLSLLPWIMLGDQTKAKVHPVWPKPSRQSQLPATLLSGFLISLAFFNL